MRWKHVWQHSSQILKYWISTDNQDYQTDHLFLFFIYINMYKKNIRILKPEKLQEASKALKV